MMHLKLMYDVLQTLGDEGGVAQTALQHWPHDPGSLRFLRASATFIFTFTHAGGSRILRLSYTSERRAEAVRAELDFVRHLKTRGVRVAEPVASSAGRDVEQIVTPLGTFNAAAFEFISGEQPECDEMTEAMVARWGGALAELHNAAAGYRAPGRPSWREHLAYVVDHLAPELSGAQNLLQNVSNKLATQPVSDATFGLIHFDFEPDNLIWQEQVWAVDFDDCAYYPFVSDVAFALREIFQDRPAGVNLEDIRVQAFIGGYRELRALDDAELANIPLLMAAHNLLTFVKLERTLAAPRPPSEPDWLVKLRQKLEKKRLEYLQGFAEATL